jgi:hypothetical protein
VCQDVCKTTLEVFDGVREDAEHFIRVPYDPIALAYRIRDRDKFMQRNAENGPRLVQEGKIVMRGNGAAAISKVFDLLDGYFTYTE